MKKKRIVFALLATLVFSAGFGIIFKWWQTGESFSSTALLYALTVFLNIILTGSIAYVIFQKYSKLSAIELRKKIIVLFLAFTGLALIISLSLVSLTVYLFNLVQGLDTHKFWQQLIEIELPSAMQQFAVWVLIGSAVFFYIIWTKAVKREQILRENELKYQYQNLKSQVNPHFLFNSLNTLSEIVYEDAPKADKYIQKLSKIYRYILSTEEDQLVSLSQELEFVAQYFDLQKERMASKIRLSIAIENAEAYSIPPVSIQTLVENAIKHNRFSDSEPLHIQIYIEDLHLHVSNNLQKKQSLEASTQKGLKNLNQRIRLICDKEMIITEAQKNFIVKLPLIKQPIIKNQA